MSSPGNMSLEDIIKRKQFAKNRGRMRLQKDNNQQNFKPNRGPSANRAAPPIGDVRNKIILKKRTRITDAREKLAEIAKQKDARVKLQQLRMKREIMNRSVDKTLNNPLSQEHRMIGNRVISNKLINRAFTDVSRQVRARPLSHQTSRVNPKRQMRYAPRDFPQVYNMPEYPALSLKPILRTVDNDVQRYLPKSISLIDDDEDQYYQPSKPKSYNRKTGLNLKIITRNDEVKEISSGANKRSSDRDKEKYPPPLPPSILKKRPMAAMKLDKKNESNEPAALEYRIVVSNLRSSVTGNDIHELFGDVGGLLESRLVRPGTAEVMYKCLENAQRAVELYHNRQLDGQPMNCFLVNPRSPNISTSGRSLSSKSNIPASSNSSVVPDISTFHKVLFNKH